MREGRISISNTTSLHNYRKTNCFPEKGKNCFYTAERQKEFSGIRAFFYKEEKNVREKRTNKKNVLDERTVLGYTDNRKNSSCMERFVHESKERTAGCSRRAVPSLRVFHLRGLLSLRHDKKREREWNEYESFGEKVSSKRSLDGRGGRTDHRKTRCEN